MHRKHNSVNLSLKPKLPDISKSRYSPGLSRATPELSMYGLASDITPLKQHKASNFFRNNTSSVSKSTVIKASDSSPSLPMWEIHERIDTFCIKSESRLTTSSSTAKILADYTFWETTVADIKRVVATYSQDLAEIMNLVQSQNRKLFQGMFSSGKSEYETFKAENIKMKDKILKLNKQVEILLEKVQESERLQGITQDQISKEIQELFGDTLDVDAFREKISQLKNNQRVPAADILKEILEHTSEQLIPEHKSQLVPALDIMEYQNALLDKFKSIQTSTAQRIMKYFDQKDKFFEKTTQTTVEYVELDLYEEIKQSSDKLASKLQKSVAELAKLRVVLAENEGKFNEIAEEKSKLATDVMLQATEIQQLMAKEASLKEKLRSLRDLEVDYPKSPYLKEGSRGSSLKPVTPFEKKRESSRESMSKPMGAYENHNILKANTNSDTILQEKNPEIKLFEYKDSEVSENMDSLDIQESSEFERLLVQQNSNVVGPYTKGRRKSSRISQDSSYEENEEEDMKNYYDSSRNSSEVNTQKTNSRPQTIASNSPSRLEGYNQEAEIVKNSKKIGEYSLEIHPKAEGTEKKIVPQNSSKVSRANDIEKTGANNKINSSNIIKKQSESEAKNNKVQNDAARYSKMQKETPSSTFSEHSPARDSLKSNINQPERTNILTKDTSTSQEVVVPIEKSPSISKNTIEKGKKPGKQSENAYKNATGLESPSIKVAVSLSPPRPIRKKPSNIQTKNFTSAISGPIEKPLQEAKGSARSPSLPNKSAKKPLASKPAIQRKKARNLEKIDQIESSEEFSEGILSEKVNVCTWIDQDLPDYDKSDFSAQFGPEVPMQSKEKGVYMMPFNPNNVYGLKGDRYFHTNKGIFSAQPLIPDLASSYVFAPPFHTSNN